ncbi:MAG: NHL repeat-containing protein [Planctomycetota bacterium]
MRFLLPLGMLFSLIFFGFGCTKEDDDPPPPAPSTPPAFWKIWGGSDQDVIAGVAVDSAGNIFCTGGTYSYGAGGRDSLLIKYSASAVFQWAKTWGGPMDDHTNWGIAIDSADNIYCAGFTTSFGSGGRDVLLLKYDTSGALQWLKVWGDAMDDQNSRRIALDGADNVYLCGRTDSFGAGGGDAMLLTFDPSGTLRWAKTWGGADNEDLWGIEVDAGGNIYCAGYTESFGAGGRDGLFLKYNASGALQWATTWGGLANDDFEAVAVDSSGNPYFTGSTRNFGAGGQEAVLLKYDGSGTLQWAKTWGGALGDAGCDIQISSTDFIYTVGWTENFGIGSFDGLFLKHDTAGTLQWALTWGGTLPEFLYGSRIHADGSLYIAGITESYTGGWNTITAGTETSPSVTALPPAGTETVPLGTETPAIGTVNSPGGDETGAGASDALLMKIQQ